MILIAIQIANLQVVTGLAIQIQGLKDIDHKVTVLIFSLLWIMYILIYFYLYNSKKNKNYFFHSFKGHREMAERILQKDSLIQKLTKNLQDVMTSNGILQSENDKILRVQESLKKKKSDSEILIRELESEIKNKESELNAFEVENTKILVWKFKKKL